MVTRIYRYEIHINLTFQWCVDIVIKLQIILEMYHMIIIKVVEFKKKKGENHLVDYPRSIAFFQNNADAPWLV